MVNSNDKGITVKMGKGQQEMRFYVRVSVKTIYYLKLK